MGRRLGVAVTRSGLGDGKGVAEAVEQVPSEREEDPEGKESRTGATATLGNHMHR